MKRFEGRVAVVTGGAGGLGLATAKRLAERGCEIALVDLHAGPLEAAAQALESSASKTSIHVADVSDADRMRTLPREVVSAHGAAHLLVNNAGVAVAARFEDQSLEDLQWIVAVNFWGVVHGCKFFLPELRRHDEAHIVNVSSMFGFIGVPTQSSYCATKFAVRGFSEALWAELRDSNVGVTSIHPGGIRTNIARTMRSYDDELRMANVSALERSRAPDAVAKRIVRAIEKNRLRAIVGWEAHVADALKRLLPIGTHRLIARRLQGGVGP